MARTFKQNEKSDESTGWMKIGALAISHVVIVGLILMVWAQRPANADNVKILDATTEVQTNGLYAFSVTLQHADEGWSHYADRWEVVGDNNSVLGVRTLFHPHENNVAFTRSLANVKVPIGTLQVSIRANCSIDGLTPYERVVKLPPR